MHFYLEVNNINLIHFNMADVDFGFSIHTDRQYNLDTADKSLYKRLSLIEPSIKRCIFCGGCTSGCTARRNICMSFRMISLNLRRGNIDDVKKMTSRCLLCGKCTMICPRDVNIRHIIVLLKKEFAE